MIPENILNEEAKNELNRIKEIEKTVDRENFVYRGNKCTYRFKCFKATKTFGRDISNSAITLKEADEDQSNLLVKFINLRSKTKPQNWEKKQNKDDVLKILYPLFDGREKFLMLLKVKYFQ